MKIRLLVGFMDQQSYLLRPEINLFTCSFETGSLGAIWATWLTLAMEITGHRASVSILEVVTEVT